MSAEPINAALDRPAGTWSAFAALLASSGTIVCCALPAALSALGAGAAMSSLVAAVPQIVVLSEHKDLIFSVTAVMLAIAGWLQWRNRFAPCPLEPRLRDACVRTRRWSRNTFFAALAINLVGAWFAYIQPLLTA
jgi:hypothetical protein